MKICRIFFVDYGKYFDKTEEVIIKLLRRNHEVVITPDPDYLFYSCDGFTHLDPKYSDCVKIFYTCENTLPDFNICDYALAHQHIQFQDRYYRMPYYMLDRSFGDSLDLQDVSQREFEKMENICRLAPEKALNRKFCSFLSSSGWADPVRYDFASRLSKYKKIDSGGRTLNNMGNIKIPDKMAFFKNYKFNIAFENSSLSGYTTEKIINAYIANTVPIYWGDPDVGLDFNKNAFICVNDFETIEEVVAEVIRIDNDKDAYLEKLYSPRCAGANYSKWEEGLFRFLAGITGQPFDKAKRTTKYGYNYSYSRDITALRFLFNKNRLLGKFNKKVLRFFTKNI
jgi:hypothetical protein